jgi:hypothetical protein
MFTAMWSILINSHHVQNTLDSCGQRRNVVLLQNIKFIDLGEFALDLHPVPFSHQHLEFVHPWNHHLAPFRKFSLGCVKTVSDDVGGEFRLLIVEFLDG